MNPFQTAWLVWGLIWIVLAFSAKRSIRREHLGSLVLTTLPLVIGAILLMGYRSTGNLIDARVTPNLPAFYWIGIALTIGGLAFAVWARLYIGRNWSGTVQVKTDHDLVRTGPYRFVRHPIYTGILTAFFGTGLAMNDWRGVLAYVIVLAGLLYRIKLEERWMIETFGDAYIAYRKHTKALIPLVL